MTPDRTSGEHTGPGSRPLSEREVQARLEALLDAARGVGRAAGQAARDIGMPVDPTAPRPDPAQLLTDLRSAFPHSLRPDPNPTTQVAIATVGQGRPPTAPYYHEAIELIGRRWTGAIVVVLAHRTSLRFGQIAQAVPELSDRRLSERMKELEARGLVQRTVRPGRPVRVEYELTKMGRELAPALRELERWANRWLG